jgi:predicted secreted hydrolase
VKRLVWLMLCVAAACARAEQGYPEVRPGTALVFPADHGSHPAFRTEWWYVTAWLQDEAGHEYGAQLTFFRSRPRVAEGVPSAFAPTQLIFAHAALADPRHGRLRHDQRAGRAGFGLSEAKTGDTDVRAGNWRLVRSNAGYYAIVGARAFRFELDLRPTQSTLPQGEAGYSRKGPRPREASHYYSVPQLAAAGNLTIEGRTRRVTGRAWLDHEWSSELLTTGAVGWDWVGLNLDDGGALTAFRIRDGEGRTLWAGGSLRRGDGTLRILYRDAVHFAPRRHWRSPRSGTDYPVAMAVTAGETTFELAPLLDDQELDARASTGTIYWEGAVYAAQNGAQVGRGYLELTGYWKPLKL